MPLDMYYSTSAETVNYRRLIVITMIKAQCYSFLAAGSTLLRICQYMLDHLAYFEKKN